MLKVEIFAEDDECNAVHRDSRAFHLGPCLTNRFTR